MVSESTLDLASSAESESICSDTARGDSVAPNRSSLEADIWELDRDALAARTSRKSGRPRMALVDDAGAVFLVSGASGVRLAERALVNAISFTVCHPVESNRV